MGRKKKMTMERRHNLMGWLFLSIGVLLICWTSFINDSGFYSFNEKRPWRQSEIRGLFKLSPDSEGSDL